MTTFSTVVRDFGEKSKVRIDDLVRKVVIDVGARLVEKSPVGDPSAWKNPPPPGYVGGRFRANWQYGFNQRPIGDLSDIDPSGAVSNERIITGTESNPAAGVHYLMNNLPYAQRLETGWSSQAPQGMVNLTVIEFDGIVKRKVEEVKK
jgi:hypothetical protein